MWELLVVYNKRGPHHCLPQGRQISIGDQGYPHWTDEAISRHIQLWILISTILKRISGGCCRHGSWTSPGMTSGTKAKFIHPAFIPAELIIKSLLSFKDLPKKDNFHQVSLELGTVVPWSPFDFTILTFNCTAIIRYVWGSEFFLPVSVWWEIGHFQR